MLEKTKYFRIITNLSRLNYNGVLDAVIDNAILYRIAEYNREQLSKGMRSDGSMLDDYSDISKDLFDKPDGPMTLYEDGLFYESIEAVIVGDVIAILSNPLKRDEITGKITDLKVRYEPTIIGISEENLEKIRKEIIKKAGIYIRELLRKS